MIAPSLTGICNVSKGREPLDFLEAVKEEKSRISQPLSLESRRFSYVDRGFYSEQLERFFRFFPREQFKIVKFEQFRSRQAEVLGSIFHFLGLDSIGSLRSKDRNVVPYERAMTVEERKRVYEVFSEDIARLEKLLGWDCSDWKL